MLPTIGLNVLYYEEQSDESIKVRSANVVEVINPTRVQLMILGPAIYGKIADYTPTPVAGFWSFAS